MDGDVEMGAEMASAGESEVAEEVGEVVGEFAADAGTEETGDGGGLTFGVEQPVRDESALSGFSIHSLTSNFLKIR